MRVVVGIATYRRNDLLSRLLPMVLTQVEALRTRLPVVADATVLVVDNDPDGSAHGTVAEFPTVRYAHELRPGISAARNRALDEASTADLLVFIDDDEYPADGWLSEMVTTYLDYGRPAAVGGPVFPAITSPAPDWILASPLFQEENNRLPTGTVMDGVATGNVLLDLNQLRDFGIRFDDAFGLTGGEDSVFSLSITRRGGSIVVCDEGVVYESVPPIRLTRRYVTQRAFRLGTTDIMVRLHFGTNRARRMLTRAHGILFGVRGLAGGSATAVRAMLRHDPNGLAAGVFTAFYELGRICASLGIRYHEYGR